MKNQPLELSVIVPTYDRPDAIARLLGSLGRQTLAPERFEVIIVDDGSPNPVEADVDRLAFHCELHRQENQGPAAARNLALEHCRAPLVLILNDDAVPASSLLEVHLQAHAEAPPRTAILGSFHFSEEARRNPIVQVMDRSDLLFDFIRLEHGQTHDWTYFWTCNISLPKEALLEVGGFDAENFPEAICEDVELGFRLEKLGWSVVYRADAECHHHHELTTAAFLRRGESLGRNHLRLSRKHEEIPMAGQRPGALEADGFFVTAQASYELFYDVSRRIEEGLLRVEEQYRDSELPQALEQQVFSTLRQAHSVRYWKGILTEVNGFDPEPIMQGGPPERVLTSIVIVSYDDLTKTRKCLEALRACQDWRFPTEIIVVDNGSTDGSVEFLEDQADVHLIRNEENRGAPYARNQAIPHARGEWICFMDNDAIATPGWLDRLHFHGTVDPRVGCVCPVSDRAAHGQQIPYEGGDELSEIHAFAREHSRANHRQMAYKILFPSFCVLVRRAVVEAIGGFDERFSPWGFEDDDFALRAHLAGFRARMARDVFIRHESYGGTKGETHSHLLLENWQRFANKWLPGPVPPYGDLSSLKDVCASTWSREELYVPLDSQASPVPGSASGAM